MRAGDRPDCARGFTLLAVLAALALLALATERVMQLASQQARRERETQLLRAGGAYANAIAAYRAASPGQARQWPPNIDALIEDRRFVQVRRHLREPYADPVTRSPHWTLLHAPDGGILGVASRSDEAPLRSTAIDIPGVALAAATRYSDWAFTPSSAPSAGELSR